MSNSAYKSLQDKKNVAKDYLKGLINPSYIIEKYMKTVDLTKGGFVPFKLFPRQKEIIFGYENNRDNIVTKPRQTGVSTTTAAYLAVKAAYADKEKPEVIIIIANKFASAKKFVGAIRMFLGQIPKFVWGDSYDHRKETEGHIEGKGSTETLKLCNGTVIKAVATSPDALRGWTPTYLVIDEAAYIDTFAKELYTASMAALSTGGKMIIISTPNGKDELYYKVYNNAKKGLNGFNIIELKWYEDPRYNVGLEWHKEDDDGNVEIVKEEDFTFESFAKMEQAGYKPRAPWYDDMCGKLNHDKISIARELDVKFEGSAGTVVEDNWIRFHEKHNVNKDYMVDEEFDHMWIWEAPIEDHQYIMGIDVSSGTADDYSAIVIIDTTTGNQVAEFLMKIRPEHLAKVAFKYGNLYNALTVVDTTGGYGDLLVFKLEEMGYDKLYYNKGNGDYMKKHPKNKRDKYKLTAGLKIGAKRPQIVGKLTQYIESNDLKIRSVRFISELETFVWVNGRPDHQSGFNDDIIFAAAVALWVLETEFKELEKAKAQTENILAILASGGKRNAREKVKTPAKDINNKDVDRERAAELNRKYGQKIYTSSQDPTGQFSWVFGK
jgi:hypothetical protein